MTKKNNLEILKGKVRAIGLKKKDEQRANLFLERAFAASDNYKDKIGFNNSDKFIEAFKWSETPQGHEFWKSIYELSKEGLCTTLD